MKVIIIGGGIGGLTAAIALHQAGADVNVYERVPQMGAAGAGLTLWPNALKAMDTLGIGDEIRAVGVRNVSGAVHNRKGGTLVQLTSAQMLEKYGHSLVAVHRATLADILMRHAHPFVSCGRAFSHYEQDASGVTAYFEDGTQERGDLLIGADGIRSKVRSQMFPAAQYPEYQPVYSGYTAWRGVVEFPHQRVGTMWGETWGKGQRFGLVPLQDERVYWFATANRPQGEQFTAQENRAMLKTLFAGWHEPIEALIDQTASESILHNDIIELNPMPRWHEGRVLLLGDAAHAMTPNMGQGACQAIEDAVTLGQILPQSLPQSGDLEDVMARYSALRLPRTRHIQLQSRQIGRVGQLENAALCWLRDNAAKLLPASLRNQSLEGIIGYDVADSKVIDYA